MALIDLFADIGDLGGSLFKIVVAFHIVVNVVLQYLMAPIDALGHGPIPDARFGYSVDEFYNLMEAWGEEGRLQYQYVASADLCLYIPSYVLLFGGLLWKALDYNGYRQEHSVSYVMTLAMSDCLETGLQLYLSKSYPMKLQEIAMLAVIFNQVKWAMIATLVIALLGFYVKGKLLPSNTGTKPKEE